MKQQPISFIVGIKTPLNPKDVYYQNAEEIKKYYMILILIGWAMILYMILR